MSASQRFQRELDGLQGHYDLLSEKIDRLRQARAIETDAASHFKQDMQLKQAEAERAELLTQIEALEAKIEERQSVEAAVRRPTGSDPLGPDSTPAHRPARPALPADLLDRLRPALLACGPFASAQALSAVFVDERIRPWRDQLPEASSPVDRVDQLIAYLHGQANAAGENALLLFLRVLRDRTDPQNLCHQRLAALAGELEQATRESGNFVASPDNIAGRSTPELLPEDEQFLQQQLAAHQRNLRKLIDQKSVYGAGEEPLRLLNQIEAEEAAIRKIKQQLGQ